MNDSEYIHLSHNVSNLVYHFVCPTKYRRVGIELRYDYINFLEIGTDNDHVHFLIQSLPNYAPSKIITTIKSLTAKRIFLECPEVKKKLWGGQFWSDGYFVSSVGKHNSEKTIQEYVKNQGKQDEYKQLIMSLK